MSSTQCNQHIMQATCEQIPFRKDRTRGCIKTLQLWILQWDLWKMPEKASAKSNQKAVWCQLYHLLVSINTGNDSTLKIHDWKKNIIRISWEEEEQCYHRGITCALPSQRQVNDSKREKKYLRFCFPTHKRFNRSVILGFILHVTITRQNVFDNNWRCGSTVKNSLSHDTTSNASDPWKGHNTHIVNCRCVFGNLRVY